MSLTNAVRAFNSGDLRKAHGLCQKVLATQPNNPVAMNLMGAIAGNAGRHELAADWLERAVAAKPSDLGYRINFITALLQLDRADDARTALDNAISEFPNSHELCTFKGILAGRQGELEEAAEMLLRAIKINPKSATAYFNLSVIHRRQGDVEESVELLHKTLEVDPTNVQAVNNLAGHLLDTGEFIEALRCLQKFLDLDPRSAQAYYNLSVALDAAGDAEQSLIAIRNALSLDPKLRRGQFKLVNQLIASGQFDEASELLEQWQVREPDDARLCALQSRFLERQGDVEGARIVFDRIKDEDRELPAVQMSEATLLQLEGNAARAVELLESILEKRGADAAESLGIRFQMGSLHDKLKDYDKAFENYSVGNSLRHNALPIPFDEERTTENFRRIANAYAEGWRDHQQGTGFASDIPIFIVGMPRSGTSLTEQILGCHSKVHPAGELKLFSNMIRSTHDDPTEQKAKKAGFTIVENDLAGHHSPVIPTNFDPTTLREIGKSYVEEVAKLANGGEPHVTDKMPYNYLFAPMIKMALPNAKIIHTRRNPVDTCLSCYFQNFAGGSEFSFDLHNVGVYYRNYDWVMNFYRHEIGLEMLEIDYEETVTDTEAVVRRILDYCDLEFEDSCLSSHKSKRPVVTASYQQVREPVYTKSVARWKNYEHHLGSLIEALGPLAE